MPERFIHRKLETISRDYLVERVNIDDANHFELTTTNAINGEVIENRVIFNNKREANSGLLDRACTR